MENDLTKNIDINTRCEDKINSVVLLPENPKHYHLLGIVTNIQSQSHLNQEVVHNRQFFFFLSKQNISKVIMKARNQQQASAIAKNTPRKLSVEEKVIKDLQKIKLKYAAKKNVKTEKESFFNENYWMDHESDQYLEDDQFAMCEGEEGRSSMWDDEETMYEEPQEQSQIMKTKSEVRWVREKKSTNNRCRKVFPR